MAGVKAGHDNPCYQSRSICTYFLATMHILFSMCASSACHLLHSYLYVLIHGLALVKSGFLHESSFPVHVFICIVNHVVSLATWATPLCMRWMGVCSLYLTVPTSNHDKCTGVCSTHCVAYMHTHTLKISSIPCSVLTGFLAFCYVVS